MREGEYPSELGAQQEYLRGVVVMNDCIQPDRAASAALTTSDTSNRKPTPRIRPNDKILVHTTRQMPLVVVAARGVSQMRSRSRCSSPNTLVAPISNDVTPAMVATQPPPTCADPASRALTAAAPASPINACICANTCWRTVSFSSMLPATQVATSNIGAIENKV